MRKLFHPLAPKTVANTEMKYKSWIMPKQQQQKNKQANEETNKQATN